MLQSAITIHGIWSNGLWQENIAPVLYPHFRPVSVKYPYYRWLGPLDLILEPYVLAAGAVGWFFSRFFERSRQIVDTHATLLLVVWLLLAVSITFLRLGNALSRVRKEVSHAIAAGAQPHIIAHSLGSFLVGRALWRIPPMRAHRIVLAGCVLKRRFDWEGLLRAKADAFDAIRNEVSGKDWVAWAAKFLRWRFWDFGSAGRKGFLGNDAFVHDVNEHSEACSHCLAASAPARVHNFISPHLGHSGVLETSDFASNYWLPFFLEIEPSEFHLFLRVCSGIVVGLPLTVSGGAAGKLEDEQFKKIAAKLLFQKWSWAGGQKIEEYVRTQIERYYPGYEADPRRMSDLIKQVVIGVCRAGDDARDALSEKLDETRKGERKLDRYDSPTRDSRISSLNPRQAVLKALESAVKQERSAR
jgi:hypothetical protein